MKIFRKLCMIVLLAFVMLLPVHATNDTNVYDDYGLISNDEQESLNTYAKQVSSQYGVNVYIRVYQDYDGYNSIEDYAEALYTMENLGDENGNAVMLLITMADRSYDIMAHGDKANAAFTDYGKDQIGENVVYYLSDGDYYGGFRQFISDAESYLQQAENGTPVDIEDDWDSDWNYDPYTPYYPQENPLDNPSVRYGIIFGCPTLLSLMICLILKSKHRSKRIASTAENYVNNRDVKILGAQDIFLYRTRHVTHIPKDRGMHGGGTSINSGGFSHSSGHF